jgi:cytoskeletal protein CcmA (bactofilin family)
MSLFGGKAKKKDQKKKKAASPAAPSLSPPPAASVGGAGRSQSVIESVVGPNTYFKGEVQGDGGLRIEGILEGVVDITGNLVITESGKVFADIKANNISIAGAVKGNIAANRVEILDTGRVWGDLDIKSLLINEGAYIRGQTVMPQDIQPPKIELPKSRQEALPTSSAPQAGTVVDVEPE